MNSRTFALSAVPYMWSGHLNPHPAAQASWDAIDSLFTRDLYTSMEKPVRVELLPTVEDIQQSFQQARQQQHQQVDARFAHAHVVHLHDANAEAGFGTEVSEAAETPGISVGGGPDDTMFQQVRADNVIDSKQALVSHVATVEPET